MSPNKTKDTPIEAPQDFAGEFALGLLSGSQLREANKRYANDSEFRKQVDEWHDRFSPMLDEIEPVAPPPHVYEAISKRLFANEEDNPKDSVLWKNLFFWRGLSLGAGTIAAGLLAAIMFAPEFLPQGKSTQPTQPDYVAALNLAKDKPTFLIRINANDRTLGIKSANLREEEEKVPELWVIPEDGKARSLGVLKRDGSTALSVDTDNIEFIKPGVTLAITLEPPGGAPNGVATGAVIAAGQLQEI